MSLLNKLFRKTASKEKKPAAPKKLPVKIKEMAKPMAVNAKKTKVQGRPAGFKADEILLSSINTEKAMSAQKLNQYVFKTAPRANKIEIAKAVGKNYNVKVVNVNIINIPRKLRRVGKTLGFKSGYKKAIVALAEGHSIEIK